MFLDLDKKTGSEIAVIDDSGRCVNYGDIVAFSNLFSKVMPRRAFICILSKNVIGSLFGFVSSLANHVVPLLLSARSDVGLIADLLQEYRPEYMWVPDEMLSFFEYEVVFSQWEYSLLRTGYDSPVMYDQLSLLLPTSGTTGSPKLVRHSYLNIEANADNVIKLFQLTPDEKAMAVLPMHYTMGLSVITSHLKAGAAVLLSDKSLVDRVFINRLKEATSFTGVPYSFEILMKLRFTRMNLPNLRTIAQGGGKLSEEMFTALAKYAQETGKRFIPTYGQSECTARMAYLPAGLALSKVCSIGFAEPGGQLSIVDDTGHESVTGEAVGELVYRGDNVTLGYAACRKDFAKADENNGVRYTGDIARRDADGCYYIVGRISRFVKICGVRIGLDEVENLIRSKFNSDCFCRGNDEKVVVLVTNADIASSVPSYIEEKIHLYHKYIEVQIVDSIVRNEAGKVVLQ